MSILRRRPRQLRGVSIIAMIDAFVGGISIILILIMISDPSDRTPDTIPRGDIAVACFDRERYVIFGGPEFTTLVGEPIDRLDLSRELVAFTDPTRLSLRVQFIGPASHLGCLARAQDLVETANQLPVPPANGVAPPVFLTDLRLVPEDRMPPLSEVAQ